MKKLLLATLVFVCTQAFAQKSPEQMGGVYYAYPIERDGSPAMPDTLG